MTRNDSSARPHPCSGCSAPASVYVTVSRSGETARPWKRSSSAVLTTTVTSAGSTTRTRPRRKRAAPTPPASATIMGPSVGIAPRVDRMPRRQEPPPERGLLSLCPGRRRRGERRRLQDGSVGGLAAERLHAGLAHLDGLVELLRHLHRHAGRQALELLDDRLDALADV